MKAALHYRLAVVIAGLLVISACELIEDITKDWTGGEASFIPTPVEVAERMLEMAQVGARDLVYDLGSGDGRIVIRAAEKYGAKGVGIEIDPKLVERSQEDAKRRGVSHLVEFRAGDIRKTDISGATVVTLYLTADMNLELRPTFERQLKPGTRIVSHDHAMDGWTPLRIETLAGTWYHDHRIYLWKVGRTK